MLPQNAAKMTPKPNDSIRPAGSAATVRSSAREALVVVVGLIIEGLLPIGSIDGEDQNLH